MNVLITGAAGNLGTQLTRHLLQQPVRLRLLVHRKQPAADIVHHPDVAIVQADLGDPSSLGDVCKDIDCIVHLAGVLFKPGPKKFLHTTNVQYVKNIVDVAIVRGVKKFILISFPHVEGETTPLSPARGVLDVKPNAIHSRTRLEAEKYLFHACADSSMRPVVFRAGVIYGREVKLIEGARWLMRKHLFAIWKKPTWLHLLSLPDFLRIVEIGIERGDVSGIYNLCDDEPILLQDFLSTLAKHWGYAQPRKMPASMFYLAASMCETFANVFKTSTPLTQDMVIMGMTSVVADTSRMKKELMPVLLYPSLLEGIVLM